MSASDRKPDPIVEPSNPPQNPELDSVLVEYIQLSDAEKPACRARLLAEHPSRRDELQEFFQTEDWMASLIAKPDQQIKAAKTTLPDANNDDFEIISEIARGGMGVVFKARQKSLNRMVAIKRILKGKDAPPEDIQRFRIEAEAAAKLNHPGIVQVYDVKLHHDELMLVMHYVPGETLRSLIEKERLSHEESARIVRDIAHAMAFAHHRGVIHRDLKPSNVLLDLNRKPMVTDFGLSVNVEADSRLTMSGQIIGTPGYISPEQASGKREVGPATDIFSLGATLYEMLTGQTPFSAATPIEAILQVLDSDPVRPGLVDPNLPSDLESIVLRCLEKDPDHRYPTMQELADDLDRFLAGESVHAQSINLTDRLIRTLTRSQHEGQMRYWGRGLCIGSVVIAVFHLLMFALDQQGFPWLWSHIVPRLTMLASLACVLRLHRISGWFATNSLERLIWSTWIGYFLASFVAEAVVLQHDLPRACIFAISSLLAGVSFFAIASQTWGYIFLLGAMFIVGTPMLLLIGPFSILGLGLLWTIAFLVLGIYYLRVHYKVDQSGQSSIVKAE